MKKKRLPIIQKCANCWYFRRNTRSILNEGACRRFPPNASGYYSSTDQAKWCGEWSAAMKLLRVRPLDDVPTIAPPELQMHYSAHAIKIMSDQARRSVTRTLYLRNVVSSRLRKGQKL